MRSFRFLFLLIAFALAITSTSAGLFGVKSSQDTGVATFKKDATKAFSSGKEVGKQKVAQAKKTVDAGRKDASKALENGKKVGKQKIAQGKKSVKDASEVAKKKGKQAAEEGKGLLGRLTKWTRFSLLKVSDCDWLHAESDDY